MHGAGPLVVLAGAGTGKTRTLLARVACLIDRGADPDRVLLLTFTRRAADEMLSRAAASCRERAAAQRLWGGTFHAIAHKLVCVHAELLGLPPAPSVLDGSDARDLIDLLRQDRDLAGVRARFPTAGALADIYSRAVNTARPAREVIACEFPWCEPHTEEILGLFRDYVARKRERGLLDFDDLLLAWRSMLTDATLGAAMAARWDHVLVDEYQDVNQVQVDIVRLLRPDGRGLTVVGDDAQAVYGFRGADSKHLIDVTHTYRETTIVRLERNFRSRQRLLDLANAVRPVTDERNLTLYSERTGGARARLVRCHDASAEARLVVDAVLQAAEAGERLRDQAVLMRAGHHSDLLEVELTARRVPFVKFGGLSFLESAHVKDFIAVLRLIDNRVDEIAWFRVLRMHTGIGPGHARALLGLLTHSGNADSTPTGSAPADVVTAAPARTRTALAATLTGIEHARQSATTHERVAIIVTLLNPLITARYANYEARLGDLDRLAGSAAAASTLAAFAAELTLDPPASTSDFAGPPSLDEDYLVLSTVHSAKGLEWDSVHLIHAVDGAFPSDMALSSETGLLEEQRLFYVALTRARDDLAIYTPLRMPHHRNARDDKHSFAPASRFLDDAALATLDIIETAPPRPVIQPLCAGRVALPNLDELWA